MKPMKLRLSALSMLTAAALAFSPMIPQAVPDTPAAFHGLFLPVSG